MQTPNLVDENIEKIGRLFPNCLTERTGADGKTEQAIDFDKLKQELSKSIVDGDEERYQFTWPGKKQAIITANAPINKTLRPCREESVDFDNTENLYIEGDNLDVLKLLREDYLGKVKMIYIDPPYNTGNDFVYEDDFAQSTDDYIGHSGQRDDDGNRLIANTENNGRFHTDWLNMIYPRLKVAKDFLSEDGVIFISIDDNEQKNLKNVCDEIFGSRNFVAQLVWERAFSPKNDARYISNSHDYILLYAKSIDDFKIGRLPRTEEAVARYSNPDNDPRGVWQSGDMLVKTYSASCDYPVTTPSGRVINPPEGRCWRFSQEAFLERVKDNRIWFGPNGDGVPRIKRFLNELKFEGMAPTSILFYKDVGHSQEGAQEVIKLFGNKGVFDGPKPTRLLKRLMTIANLKDDSVVLDFFSGSGTTADALMQMNKERNTQCKFILVQIPESTSESKKDSGFSNICEIGKERIRLAGKRILEERKVNQFDTTDHKLDVGFRVLKLDSSNMEDVYYKPYDVTNDLFARTEDNIKEDRTDEDLLFQVMLEMTVPLSAKIHSEEICSKKVMIVDDDYLIACFDKDITDEVVTDIAKRNPQYFVMRDSSAMDDSVITNFETIFQTYSKNTVRKIL